MLTVIIFMVYYMARKKKPTVKSETINYICPVRGAVQQKVLIVRYAPRDEAYHAYIESQLINISGDDSVIFH